MIASLTLSTTKTIKVARRVVEWSFAFILSVHKLTLLLEALMQQN